MNNLYMRVAAQLGRRGLLRYSRDEPIERETYTTFRHPQEGYIDLRRIALHGPPRQPHYELVETYKDEHHSTPARDEAHGRALLANRIEELTKAGWRRNVQHRYAAAKDTGEQWITIGAHRNKDGERSGGTPVKISGGKIVSGPKHLKGKTLKGLGKTKPHAELKRAIHKAHKEHGFAKQDIHDAIEFVHGERSKLHNEREGAKEQARKPAIPGEHALRSRWPTHGP
ncbi:MAG TPA: hypothetical protein PK867_16500, partial [Pirellulales bacterium]|nr:hypothetical protein [Pirellulales bacterium]